MIKKVLLRFFLVVVLIQMSASISIANNGLWLAVWNNRENPDSTRLAAISSLCGNEGYLWTHPDSTIHYSKIGFDYAAELRDSNYMARLLLERGRAYRALGNLPEALNTFEAAKSIAEQSKITGYKIPILTAIANCYQQYGKYSEAIDLYYEVLSLQENSGDKKGTFGTKLNIGLIYLAIEDYSLAIDNFELFLEHYEKEEHDRAIVVGLANLAAAYFGLEQYEKSLHYYHRLIIISRRNNFQDIASNLYGRGVVFYKLNKPEAAESSYQEALHSLDQETNKGTYAAVLMGLAYLREKSNPDSAILLAEQALNYFKTDEVLEYQTDAAELLSRLYEGQNDYETALEFHKIYSEGRDSLRGEALQKKLFREQAEYQYEKRRLSDQVKYEHELAVQEVKSKTILYLLAVTGFFVICISVAALIVQKKNREHERRNLLKQIEQIKEQFALQSIGLGVYDDFKLCKEAIEKRIGAKLNLSSWNILNAILEDPTISNRDIASQVFLSVEGVSSALRKMYVQFQINSDSTQNKKIALLTEVIKISL